MEGGFFAEISTLFHRGGPFVMSAITLVFIASVCIICERIIRLWFRYDLSNSDAFMAAVQKLVMNNSIENAIRLCKKSHSKLLPYVLAEGLKRANETPEEISNSIDQATLTVLPKANRFLAALGTTANVATLCGLLGTIFGLIRAFGAAAHATGAQKQTILTEGISEALTATSFGLSTALLSLLAHGFFTVKQQAIVSSINRHSSKLNDLLYTRKLKMSAAKTKG